MKFHLNSFNGCKLTKRKRNSIDINLREITPKISKAELWFFCMTHCHIVLYKCMIFNHIALTVINLQSSTNWHLLMLQGEYFEKYTGRFIVEQIPWASFQGGGLRSTTFVDIYQNVRLGL